MLLAHMAVDDRDGHDDPWAQARTIAREDVHAALAPRERRCPACGAAQRGGGRLCTTCGADLTARFSKGIPRRRLLYVCLAVLAVAAVSVPIIGSLREDAGGKRERATARQQALEAAERVRLTHDSRAIRAGGPPLREGADPLEHRAALVTDAESRIARDARGRVAAGSIDGDIRGAQCDPFPKTQERNAAEQDPATRVGRYDCVAYTSKVELGRQNRAGLFGYPYWLVIDYADSKLVWCKVTPRAGEGGRSLAAVPVPVPCRDPAGPG
jgi:hypothetical protein